jgi:hypothetical protein
LRIGPEADSEEVVSYFVAERVGFRVIGTKVNDRLGFDLRGRNEFVEESEQIEAGADRSALYFGKIADGSSRRDLEGVESAHGDWERADMLILLQERPREMKC